MLTFITEHLVEIFFGLVSAGALTFCKYLHGELKKYRKLLAQQKDEQLEKTIDSRIEPIQKEIEELRKYVMETKDIEKNHMQLIISSYKFRLVQLCKAYIKQGYMTQEQYDQLSEFYRVYSGLGGNGQAKEYYDLAQELPIRSE